MALKHFRFITATGLFFAFFLALPVLVFGSNEFLDKGEDYFNRGELSLAYTQITKSLKTIDNRYDEIKARLFLARIHVENGKIGKAREQFAEVISVSPSLKLDEVEYSPNIIRIFNQTRGQMLGSISITTQPSGCDVYLEDDGKGFSPITIIDLPEGKQRLRISKQGFKDEERVVLVNPGEPENIFIELDINDINPPSIAPKRVEDAKAGLSHSISAKITDDNAVERSYLFYRSKKNGEFKRTLMEPAVEKDVYYGIVPSEDVYGDSLEYYFSSEDAGGNIAFEGDSNDAGKLKILTIDREPPIIEHEPIESISDASRLLIEAAVSDDFGVAEVSIAYRTGTRGKYFIDSMDKGDTYSIEIPKSRIRTGIFEYYLTAKDSSGNTRFSGNQEKPHRINIYRVRPYFEGIIVSRDKKAGMLSRKVAINLGSKHRLKKGDIFFVFRIGQEISDPITKEILSVEEIVLGKIKILRVSSRTSLAEVIKENRKLPIGLSDFIRKRPGKTYGLKGMSVKKREIKLLWNSNHSPETAGYYIHRSFAMDGRFLKIGKVKGIGNTTYLDRSRRKNRLEDGVEYYYKVAAFNSKGGIGRFSDMLSVRTKKGPNPPALFSASSGEAGQITLKWSVPSDRAVRGYLIKVSGSKNGPFTKVMKIDDSKISSWVYGGKQVEHGREYYFQITSIDKKGKEGNSATVIAKGMSLSRPSPPTGLHILATGVKSLLLQWERHSDPDVKGYRLYRSGTDRGSSYLVGSVDSRFRTDLRVEADGDGGLWFYFVVAVSVGEGESVPSNIVKAAMVPLPDSPQGVKAESGMVRQVKLTWQSVGAGAGMVSGYAVYRSGDGKKFDLIRKIRGSSKDEFSDNDNLEDNKSYYYKVVSYNVAGIESIASLLVKAVTRGRPSRPESLAGSSGGAGHATLTWTHSNEKNIWKYKIWRSKNADAGFKLFGVSKGTVYRDEPLEHGQKYYYMVSAINSGGLESEPSETVFITTKLPPEPPRAIEAVSTATEVRLRWKPPASGDVDKYKVYEKSLFESRVVATVKKAGYNITGLEPGSFLSYSVTAVSSSGLESRPSKAVNIKTLPKR